MQQHSPSATHSRELRRPWNAVHNWAYWLDNPDLKQLSSTSFELVVIDYSADGSAGKAFTRKQIDMLRRTSCSRRVVSYLSIGQAESYRGYWQQGWKVGTPAWLDAPDPDWGQNYWVHYWEGEDFGIIVQNAEELAAHHPNYVRLVTGIGREEVYVQATNRPTSQPARSQTEKYLDLFHQYSRGKLVLTVDYANRADLVRTTYERARVKGYIPYVTGVDLDRLQMNSGYEPTCHPVSYK